MYQKTTLKNGLRVITVPMENTKAVTILVLVGTGSKYETKETNGISHFLEHMLFKGTKKRPNQQKIAEILDKVGGAYNAFTEKECTGYWAKVNASHFDLALDWVSDIFLNSKFEEKEVRKEKGVIAEEINYGVDTPAIYIYDLWEKILYENQPAGWLTIGRKENILKIKRRDFLSYLKNHYASKNMVVCVAGDIKRNFLENRLKKYFSGLNECKPKQKQKVIEKQDKPKILLQSKKTDQTHLCLGVRAYDLFDSRKYAQSLLAVVLGGMMSSRLFILIRGKGLAYYISTISYAYTDSGYVVSSAGIDNQRVEKAIKEILKEYKKLKRQKITGPELKKAKDFLKGHLILSLELSDAQASFYGMQELLEEKILTPEQVFKKIDAVTSDDIMRVAQDIFKPEKLNLALIGPFKDKTRFEKILKI